MSKTTDKNSQELSRRKFLHGAGASLAGVALAAGGVGAVFGAYTQSEANASAPVEAASWPFEYKQLDPNKAAEIGYAKYKEDG